MVPVTIIDSAVPVDDSIKANSVPRSVTLKLQYYQRSQARKRIIVASIAFDDYSSKEQDGKVARDFNLLVEYRAMDYLSLLNGFSFDPPIYLILFLIAGTASMFFYVVFWAFQRVFTRLQRPPKLAIWTYLRIVLAPVRGCLLAFIPCLIIFAVIHGLLRSLKYPLFSDFNELYTDFESGSQWTNTGRTSVATLLGLSADKQVQQGRIAIAIVTWGLYLCLTAALAFIPGKEERGEKSIMSLFDPKSLSLRDEEKREDENTARLKRIDGWYRTQYLLGCIVSVLVNTVVLEYSFSAFFRKNLYASIVGISVGFSLQQAFLVQLLGDALLVQPMTICFNVMETIVLMGSPDFLEFIQLFIFQLLFKTAMRVYLLPGVQNAKDLVAYLGAVLRRQQEKRDREEDLEEGEELDDDDDVLNEVEFEGFSPAENIIQMYAAYSSELISLLMYPIIILFVWWGEDIKLSVGSHYGVRTTDFVYYVLFAITVIPFRLVCDTLVHASQELFHGWKILDYLKYCAHRFRGRSERWRGWESEEDESLREHLRMVDLMCFSSQYYFVISIGAYGCLFLMFGFELLARNYHNPFSDKMTFPVAFFVLLLIWCIEWLCKKIGVRYLWHLPPKTSDDLGPQLPPKDLMLPDFGKKDDEIDITSESFKHRFLNANRSWIIEQLRGALGRSDDGPLGPEGMRGIGDDEGMGGENPYGISDDEGSSSDDDNMEVPLDDAAQAVLRAWLSRTRAQLGLPAKGITRPDISSDDDSGGDTDDEQPPPKLSKATEDIARDWLAKVRGNLRAQGRGGAPDAEGPNISDDDSSEEERDRPTISASQRTVEIAKRWLSKVRPNAAPQQRRAAMDVSDDDSSSSGDDNQEALPVSATSARIARMWLSKLASRRRGRGAQARDNISSDDSSGSDDGGTNRNTPNPPRNLSESSKKILREWLTNIR